MIRVLSGLQVRRDKMERNLGLTRGLIMSEALMLELARRGMARDEAYRLVRELALKAIREEKPFLDIVLEDERITSLIGPEELRDLLRPEGYLGTAVEQVSRVVEMVSGHPCVAKHMAEIGRGVR